MFPTGKKLNFFTILLMMAALILVGCDGGNGGDGNNDDNDNVNNLDGNFGNNGIVVVDENDAFSPEIPDAQQEFINQQRRQQRIDEQREQDFINRISPKTRKALDQVFGSTTRAANDELGLAISFNAAGDRIIAVGTSERLVGIPQLIFVQMLADGSLDVAFDGDGFLFVNLGNTVDVFDVVVEADGDIVACGSIDNGNLDVLAIRVSSAGVVDAAFGNQGNGTFQFDGLAANNNATAVAVDLDSAENIILTMNDTTANNASALRLDTTGNLDATFGVGGVASTDVNNTNPADGIADANDNVVIVGLQGANAFLFRFLNNGTADNNFGDNAGLKTIGNVRFTAVTEDGDNDLVVTGSNADINQVLVQRFLGVADGNGNAAGDEDPNFNNGDAQVFTASVGGDPQQGLDVFINADNDIVVVGSSTVAADNRGFISKVNDNGSVDTALFFESLGLIANDDDVINEALQKGVFDANNNRIVAVGAAEDAGNDDFDMVVIGVAD